MARALSARRPETKPFSIWHVRRNTEMRAGIWSRDVLGLPIKLVFTSAAQRRHSAFPRWLISRMDAVIATTDKAAEFIAGTHAVVPHGVDTKRFHPTQDRLSAWREHDPDSTRAIATVGRIRPEKGTDVFVDAMIRALPDLPDTVALVIGRAGGKLFCKV
jgi:mannosyltransferase